MPDNKKYIIDQKLLDRIEELEYGQFNYPKRYKGLRGDDLKYIQDMVKGDIENALTKGKLVWNVGWIFVGIFTVFGALALAGAAYFAKNEARLVAQEEVVKLESQDVAAYLKNDEMFMSKILSQFDDAVIAFDRPAACPNGWINVGDRERERFSGRTLIVTGPAVSGSVTARDFDRIGGTERVSLKREQIPNHSHETTIMTETSSTIALNNDGVNTPAYQNEAAASGSTGNNEAHDNMPPFISLYFCKKKSG